MKLRYKKKNVTLQVITHNMEQDKVKVEHGNELEEQRVIKETKQEQRIITQKAKDKKQKVEQSKSG